MTEPCPCYTSLETCRISHGYCGSKFMKSVNQLRLTGLLLAVVIVLPALVFRQDDLLNLFLANGLWGLLSLGWFIAPFLLTWQGLSLHSTKCKIRLARIANGSMLFVIAFCMAVVWTIGDIRGASIASLSVPMIAFLLVGVPFFFNLYALRCKQRESQGLTTR